MPALRRGGGRIGRAAGASREGVEKPITGPEGNVEFLLAARRGAEPDLRPAESGR